MVYSGTIVTTIEGSAEDYWNVAYKPEFDKFMLKQHAIGEVEELSTPEETAKNVRRFKMKPNLRMFSYAQSAVNWMFGGQELYYISKQERIDACKMVMFEMSHPAFSTVSIKGTVLVSSGDTGYCVQTVNFAVDLGDWKRTEALVGMLVNQGIKPEVERAAHSFKSWQQGMRFADLA